MSLQIVIRPAAESDLADAFKWYEERRRGLGDDLLLSIEASLAAIRERPEAFPIVHRDIRRALIRRFPFGIFYILARPASLCWRSSTRGEIRSSGKTDLENSP